jgi:hypothetical protein
MSLEDDLLEQAGHLARRDPTRPKQASLRRAISTAYYALFHLLVREATAALVSDPGLRSLVPRAFDHAEMKRACRPFAAGDLTAHLKQITPVVPAELRAVAEAFIDLQQGRHEADYNVATTFRRVDVLGLVQRAEAAFRSWQSVRYQQAATVFLVSLLFTDRWKK